jgi:hypothetical protein
MFWAVLMARLVLGGMFFVLSLNYYLHLFAMPTPEMPPRAMEFGKVLGESGYMDAVKVFELVGGLLVLSGRLVPLGLVLLTPVAVNILFFEIFLTGQAGPGVALVVLCFALVWAYRSHFAPLFAFQPRIG